VHFAACVGSIFAPDGTGHGAADALDTLCDRAGLSLTTPPTIESLCCGTPWKSKGLTDGHAVMRQRVLPAMWEATDHGRLPVICEASSCTEGLVRMFADQQDYPGLRVIDAVTFVAAEVLPHLSTPAKVGSAAVHPTCSTAKMQGTTSLLTIAESLAENVDVPRDWGCCAFAGDRGMLHPELTASATRAEAVEVNERQHDLYLSSNRTCEIGLSRATGHTYEHVLEALERATRP
jgi:D-lactate dehydrogenase